MKQVSGSILVFLVGLTWELCYDKIQTMLTKAYHPSQFVEVPGGPTKCDQEKDVETCLAECWTSIAVSVCGCKDTTQSGKCIGGISPGFSTTSAL